MLLAIAYSLLLWKYRRAWRALPDGAAPEGFEPTRSITVLLPARNEAAGIEACLRSIAANNYPHNLLTIIVIDDFSDDDTAAICRSFPLQIISLAQHLPPEAQRTANKKKALELGVAQAQSEIVVTTDADCLVGKEWLRHIAYAFENPDTQMVCGPVVFHQEKNGLQRFQSLDFLGMMGITGAGIQMGWHPLANGANLAYRKTAFEAVGGYAGNQHLASGDDVFLLQKVVARWPKGIQFLKNREAVVRTEAAPNWRAFWAQRLRWGTKNKAIRQRATLGSLLLVWWFCWSILLHGFMALFECFRPGIPLGIFSGAIWVFLFQLGLKALSDALFLSEMARFFKRQDLLRWFWPSFFMHILYITLVGTASIFFKKFTWKNRRAT